MAGGKQTPRQKMIGMMYLVLTALLALNVSVEVLDAFVLVDRGLQQTNRNFERNLELLYSAFEDQLEDNPARVEDYYERAQQARNLSQDLVDFILNNRSEMIALVDKIEVEVADTLSLLDMKAKDNYSRSSTFWLIDPVEGGTAATTDPGGPGTRGYILRNMIENFKEEMIALLPPGTELQLGLDIDGPFYDKSGREISWQHAMFDRQIPVAAATNLSRLVTEVRNAEFDVVRELFEAIGAGTFTFDQVTAKLIPTSNIVIQGDYYEAEVLVAAYDSKQEPEVFVGGQRIDGTTIRIPATREGLQTISGSVRVMGPDGPETHEFSETYTVQRPTATVSADAMNVFYMGVPNPVSISVPGIPTERLEARISGSGNQLSRNPGGGYTVRLSTDQSVNENVTISVFARDEGQLRNMGQSVFRVRVVPDPIPEIAGQSEGVIAKEILAGAPIIPRMKNFDFQMDFRITSFTMNTTVAGEFIERSADSNVQTEDMEDLIRRATRGQRFTFQDIRAIGDDGRERNLPPMVFRIQ
ncbi:MAG: gliding motility protein GldM [Bacteroidota bacterium]